MLREYIDKDVLLTMPSVYSNAVILGIPISTFALGTPLPAIIVNFLQVFLIIPFFLIVLSVFQGRINNDTFLYILKKTFIKNPIIFATILGVSLSFLKIKLPNIIWVPLDVLGEVGIPTAIFSLGITLAEVFKKAHFKFNSSIFLSVFFKVIVLPVIAFCIGKYMNLSNLQGLVLTTSLPAGMLCYVFSYNYNLAIKEISLVVFLSTIISFITITIIIHYLSFIN